MSDTRAITRQRGVELHEGVYLEKAEERIHAVEAWLRDVWARVRRRNASKKDVFVAKVARHEQWAEEIATDALAAALRELVPELRRRGVRSDVTVAKCFALIREGSRRVLKKRHHDVQVLAGRALLDGNVAEMATGEGKTLAATLAVCTAAATGAKVHVVTVNDYLAERDADENRPLYELFGFSVGSVTHETEPGDRPQVYACDIVHVSNKELTFDYLKDRIAVAGHNPRVSRIRALRSGAGGAGGPATLLKGLHMAIIDEADSVLIDEARTPLIISETLPDDLGEAVYQRALTLARGLQLGRHFQLRKKQRDAWLTTAGQVHLAELTAGDDGLWKSPLWRQELVSKALSAVHLFQRDEHYIINEDKVQIVDEFTGRVMADRTWERGLHQMIEAKEGTEISGQRKTLSQITYQRFFSRYILLSGMTGTAREVIPELKRVYDLGVVGIPTHKPGRRKRLPDMVHIDAESKWQAVYASSLAAAESGRAVLVGTRSVDASELLSGLFTKGDIAHQVLNARQDAQEAEMIASAGQPGSITIATNMAGRGTDIHLHASVEQAGGLHVILTEFHESSRVDRQLFGRSARQGNPGSAQAIVCLEDELFTRYAPLLTRALVSVRRVLRLRLAWLSRGLTGYAQRKAERANRKIRLDVIKRDRKWLDNVGFIDPSRK